MSSAIGAKPRLSEGKKDFTRRRRDAEIACTSPGEDIAFSEVAVFLIESSAERKEHKAGTNLRLHEPTKTFRSAWSPFTPTKKT